MSWTQTITIDADLARDLIETQCALKVTSITSFGEGWDNLAFLVNERFVFRFPRREMGVECMKNELLILPYLSGKLSFNASIPIFIGRAGTRFPAPFAGYEKLEICPLSDRPAEKIKNPLFARRLGSWLREIHNVEVDETHEAQIVGDQNWRTDVEHRIEKSIGRLALDQNLFESVGFSVSDLKTRLISFRDSHFDDARCYVHGDLYSRHIIVDALGMPSGLIDWGDVHVGHPILDLSVGCMIFDEDALAEFYRAYGEVPDHWQRLCHLRRLTHSIALLPYCVEKGEENLMQWTRLALCRFNPIPPKGRL